MACVFLNNAVRNRQTEAGALAHAFSCVERIVNLRNVLRCDADACVGYFDDQRTVVGGAGGDRDATTVGYRVACVEDQVCKDLLEFAGVGVSFGRSFGVATNDLDLAST